MSDWDGNSLWFGSHRKAKAAYRWADRESYCAWIKRGSRFGIRQV